MRLHHTILLCAAAAFTAAACTDLSITRIAGEQPDMEAINSDPVISLKAAQSPDNVWNITFTYGQSISEENYIYIHANRPAESSFSVDLKSAGEEFVAEYSAKTGTEYQLLPQAFYRLSGGDYIDVQRGIQDSEPNTLTVYARNLLGNVLEPGRYLLPLVATCATETVKDTTLLVDISVREQWTDPDGYEVYTGDDMFTVFYINTAEYDPRLANDMILEIRENNMYSYRGLGNIVNLRTASVDFEKETGKVSVIPSADLRYVLEHYVERILPVQESGRKVCICIEGGGQGIGFCNFTDAQIDEFTASVKRIVDTYGLDGVNLWDRNTGYDKAVGNGFPEMNTTSYPKLIKALREALGSHRLITLTDYEEPTEYFWDIDATGGIQPGQYLDYAWSGYCSDTEPVQIIDPWHQNIAPISKIHPRQPIAGISPKFYGCINATSYAANLSDENIQADAVTEWVKLGYNQNGITVFYDIMSNRQNKYEGSQYHYPNYILSAWFDTLFQMNIGRLLNPIVPGVSDNQYDKWVKDW